MVLGCVGLGLNIISATFVHGECLGNIPSYMCNTVLTVAVEHHGHDHSHDHGQSDDHSHDHRLDPIVASKTRHQSVSAFEDFPSVGFDGEADGCSRLFKLTHTTVTTMPSSASPAMTSACSGFLFTS